MFIKETKLLEKNIDEKIKNSEAHIRVSLSSIEVYKGLSNKYSQGTWIHHDLGLNLAQ